MHFDCKRFFIDGIEKRIYFVTKETFEFAQFFFLFFSFNDPCLQRKSSYTTIIELYEIYVDAYIINGWIGKFSGVAIVTILFILAKYQKYFRERVPCRFW